MTGYPRLHAVAARDIRRAVSVPAPWLVAGLGIFMASSTTAGLLALRSNPSTAAALASLPALAGALGGAVAGSDLRYRALPAEVLLAGGKTRYWRRTIAAMMQLGCAAGLLMALSAGCIAAVAGHPLASAGLVPVVLAKAAFAGACWGGAGASFALITGGQVGGVTVPLVYLLIVEPVLETAGDSVSRWLPGSATSSMLASDALRTSLASGARLSLVISAIMVASAAVFAKLDISVS